MARENFAAGLTKGLKGETGLFAKAVETPEMIWKTRPTAGYLKGMVYGEEKTNVLDGATVVLEGAKKRMTQSDATGFYGAVNLAPGEYSVVVSFAGFQSTTNKCQIVNGKVTALDVVLKKK